MKRTAVATRNVSTRSIVPSEAAKDPITRIVAAALNPAFPAERLRMLVPEGTVLQWVSRMIYDRAMAKMQSHLPTVSREGKIEVRAKDGKGERTGAILQSTKYAKWEDINEAVLPVLGEYGFSLTFRSGTTTDGRILVTAILAHEDGHREETSISLMHDSTGSKNAVQAVGSSLSYGKRYAAGFLLNFTTRDMPDDDANSTGKPLVVGETVNSEQIQNLKDMLEASKCPEEHLLKHLNKTRPDGHPEIAAILDLPAERYDFAVECLRMYEANRKKKEAEKKETPVARQA